MADNTTLEGEPNTDIYKEVHIKMMTSNGTERKDLSTGVDMSGALNASAALNASSALKTNPNIETMKETVIESAAGELDSLVDYVSIGSSVSTSHTNQSSVTNINTASSVSTPVESNIISTAPLSSSNNILMETVSISTPQSSAKSIEVLADNNKGTLGTALPNNLSSKETLKPETFIDDIEKFVSFVSKEGLAKKINESTASVKKDNQNVINSNNTSSYNDSGNKKLIIKTDPDEKESKPHKSAGEDNVDEDLKSYAIAVNDMLDKEGDVPTDGNELDAEIKTMVVSNTDAGEVQMTFTDNAVGRFETIGKNEEKGVDDPLSEGLSPLRKSRRPKKRKVFADFDQADDLELEMVVEEVAHAIGEETEPKPVDAPKKHKSKRKNPSPKKAKLTVEEVYESDTNEDSDGDINKDILKVRMAKCDICDKHFLDPKKLADHKKRHNKKPKSKSDYPCVVCGKVFLKREHWRRHVKIHDDIRPYACPVCKKAFRRKEHVKRHMLIHTGEKPFECEICSQRYQRADHLKKHVQQHSKDTSSSTEKGRKSTSRAGRKRRPTPKAAKLVAQSRKPRVKVEIGEPSEDHYSDGLSDEPEDNTYA